MIHSTKFLVTVRSVYGKELIYPANETADLFAKLIGQKTFSNFHMRTISELGYSVEQVMSRSPEIPIFDSVKLGAK